MVLFYREVEALFSVSLYFLCKEKAVQMMHTAILGVARIIGTSEAYPPSGEMSISVPCAGQICRIVAIHWKSCSKKQVENIAILRSTFFN